MNGNLTDQEDEIINIGHSPPTLHPLRPQLALIRSSWIRRGGILSMHRLWSVLLSRQLSFFLAGFGFLTCFMGHLHQIYRSRPDRNDQYFMY